MLSVEFVLMDWRPHLLLRPKGSASRVRLLTPAGPKIQLLLAGVDARVYDFILGTSLEISPV